MKICPICDTDYPDQHHTCPTDGAVLMASQELAAGSLVINKFKIIRTLGHGGMGIVYLAEHLMLGDQVALKFLAAELSHNPEFFKRFRNEAKAAFSLHDPNIVQVKELYQTEDGSPFISMEYVDGKSLRAALEEEPGGFEIRRALDLTHGIVSGLAAAHAQKTVHRDVKPENIVLAYAADGRETPKVLDFGIAAIAKNASQSSMTRGRILTQEYASPEQWRGVPSAELDGRTDLYAMGCVFYEMLTGHTPFHAHDEEGWSRQHQMETPRLPSESRAELADWPGLDGLVMRMLAKNRDDRPQDAEVLSELDDLRSGLVQRRTEQTAEYAHAPTVIERDWGHREQAVAAFTQPAPQPFTQPVSQPFTQLITQPAPPIEKREAGKIPVWIWGALAIVVVLAVATGFAAVRFYAPKPQSEFSQSLNPSVADKARETKAQVDSAAVNVNKRSCDLGSAAGCLELGNVYRDGVGVTADTAKAAQFYSRAKELFQKDCKEGDQASCSSLKSLQPPNSLNSANDKPASPKEQNSTQANNTKPSIVLPNVVLPKQVILPQFVKPPVPQPSTADLTQQALSFYGQKRFSEASPLFDKACMGGGWEACKDLGIMYRYGQGIPEDDNKAAGLFAKACDAGNALGCTNLGALYANGKGVDKDDTRAAAFYNRACDAGDAMGCSNLGTLYWDGRGVPHNDSQAAALYSKACDKGNAAACSNLGNGYLLGRGVAKNTDQARQLYMKSCGMNNKLACDQLKALK